MNQITLHELISILVANKITILRINSNNLTCDVYLTQLSLADIPPEIQSAFLRSEISENPDTVKFTFSIKNEIQIVPSKLNPLQQYKLNLLNMRTQELKTLNMNRHQEVAKYPNSCICGNNYFCKKDCNNDRRKAIDSINANFNQTEKELRTIWVEDDSYLAELFL